MLNFAPFLEQKILEFTPFLEQKFAYVIKNQLFASEVRSFGDFARVGIELRDEKRFILRQCWNAECSD